MIWHYRKRTKHGVPLTVYRSIKAIIIYIYNYLYILRGSYFFCNFAAVFYVFMIMERKIRLSAVVVVLLLWIMPAMAEDVVYLTTEQFKARIFDYTKEKEWKYKGDKPCVIDFYTTWCGPCKRLAPIMEELSQQYCDQVVFYKADTERERELAYVFQISSIPQVMYIPVEGKPALLKGLYPKEEIVKIIEDFLIGGKR